LKTLTKPVIQRLPGVNIKKFIRVLDGGVPPLGIHTMTRNTIRRLAALPLTLAFVGIALIALAMLPSSEAEQHVAKAETSAASFAAD
jgi:hypothetical protein